MKTTCEIWTSEETCCEERAAFFDVVREERVCEKHAARFQDRDLEPIEGES